MCFSEKVPNRSSCRKRKINAFVAPSCTNYYNLPLFVSFRNRCTFRFPSTGIRILFESYIDHPFEMQTKNNKTVENSNVIYAPLKISIPEHDKKSPFPSPTGTISAANSCPTSPRQNYGDFLSSSAAAAYSYNHHKNNNNHLNVSSGNISSTNNSHNFDNVSLFC